LYAVTAGDDYAMLPGFNELVIKNDFPLGMYDFAMAVCHERSTRSTVASALLSGEFLE
jgi:hypothetical protein